MRSCCGPAATLRTLIALFSFPPSLLPFPQDQSRDHAARHPAAGGQRAGNWRPPPRPAPEHLRGRGACAGDRGSRRRGWCVVGSGGGGAVRVRRGPRHYGPDYGPVRLLLPGRCAGVISSGFGEGAGVIRHPWRAGCAAVRRECEGRRSPCLIVSLIVCFLGCSYLGGKAGRARSDFSGPRRPVIPNPGKIPAYLGAVEDACLGGGGGDRDGGGAGGHSGCKSRRRVIQPRQQFGSSSCWDGSSSSRTADGPFCGLQAMTGGRRSAVDDNVRSMYILFL